jgi:glutaredoxin
MMERYVLFGILAVFLLATLSQAVTVEVFTRDDCSPCENAVEYLELMQRRISGTEIVEYNDSKVNGSDYAYFKETADRAGFSTALVPVIVVGNDYHIGYAGGAAENDRIRAIIVKNKEAEKPPPAPEEPEERLIVRLFSSPTCPHCQAEKNFLQGIAPKYPELDVQVYNVDDEDSIDHLIELSKELNFSPDFVPVTVIDDWYLLGYDTDAIQGKLIEEVIIRKIAALGGNETANITDLDYLKYQIEIPFIGIVDTRDMGIPISTIVIGLLDGFNPCAFFVLTMLLSFLIYAKSRKRMLLIGLIFIFISAFVYFLAMLAMYFALNSLNTTLDLSAGEFGILPLVGGAIAIVVGLINLKDFFFFKKGVSLTISEDKKPKLYKRMRGLLKSQTMIEMIIATVVLAFVANSYELVCTASLPFVYNTLLIGQGIDFSTALLYLALYCTVYIIPLLVIVLVFVKRFEGDKMSKETGEMLKAISGIMMLGFGIFLIIDPGVLSSIATIISIVVVAIIAGVSLRMIKKHRQKDDKEEGAKDKDGAKTGKDKKKEKAKKEEKDESAKESEV